MAGRKLTKMVDKANRVPCRRTPCGSGSGQTARALALDALVQPLVCTIVVRPAASGEPPAGVAHRVSRPLGCERELGERGHSRVGAVEKQGALAASEQPEAETDDGVGDRCGPRDGPDAELHVA